MFSLMLLRLNAVGNKNSQHRSEETSCINYHLLIRTFFGPYMPNMQVNWLLALYIDLPGLLEDPRFCFVTQSSLTPGVDILAVIVRTRYFGILLSAHSCVLSMQNCYGQTPECKGLCTIGSIQRSNRRNTLRSIFEGK